MILHQKSTNFSLEDSIKQTDGLSKILFGSLKKVKILSTEFGHFYAGHPVLNQAYAWRSERIAWAMGSNCNVGASTYVRDFPLRFSVHHEVG